MTHPLDDASPPTIDDVRAAAARIAGHAVVTPLLESAALNRLIGGRLLAKAEPLQRTGSFKFRGAYNTIAQLDPAARAAGVIAFSSGNHAQGVALAASLFGAHATIVMPADAPAVKIANTRAYGAEVIFYDRANGDREAIAADIIARTGAALVRPYDDRRVIAGQGTIGLEIAAQAAEAGAKLDSVVVCCGGGGLVAGCALALADAAPGVPVFAAEPAGFDDTARSLAAGARLVNQPGNKTICDAIMTPTPGVITFEINRRLLAGGLVVTDAEVERAMSLALEHLKIVVEPGGAVALAAALSGKLATEGRSIAVVLSGGNVDRDLLTRVMSEPAGAGA